MTDDEVAFQAILRHADRLAGLPAFRLPLSLTSADAVYHTSLVFNGVEYLFGQGIQTCYPGSSHHGRPMEIVSLGQTSLPPDIISEYLESLRDIYTPEVFVTYCGVNKYA